MSTFNNVTVCIAFFFCSSSVLRCVLSSVADDYVYMRNLDHGSLVIKKQTNIFLCRTQQWHKRLARFLKVNLQCVKFFSFMNSSHFLSHLTFYLKLPAGNDATYSVATSVPGADRPAGELLFPLDRRCNKIPSLTGTIILVWFSLPCRFWEAEQARASKWGCKLDMGSNVESVCYVGLQILRICSTFTVGFFLL